ncbi:MAG: hypothetical protein HRT58_12370 [Crocinitomicaceae bacterium]|nr:hypothetical protein [Flavobacteriales bacterium]NQZ36457.1 hypothetical protein [Crocinitomicaceae bacterium]
MKLILIVTLLLSFNSLSQNLYTIKVDYSSGFHVDFASIDPANGADNTLSGNFVASGIQNSTSTIDPTNKYFHFLSPNDTIVTIDINSGNVISSAQLSAASTYNYILIEYCFTNGLLYSLFLNTNGDTYLGTIDWQSGNVNILSPTPLPSGVGNFTSSLDPFNNQFIYLNGSALVTVDLSTGTVVYNSVLSTAAQGYVHSMEFDCGSSNSLYGVFIFGYSWRLGQINNSNGNVSLLPANAVNIPLTIGASSIDPINESYYLLANDTIISLDLNSGNILSFETLSNSTITDYVIIENDFNCGESGIESHSNNESKNLIQILDITGRITDFIPNTILIYVYDDGSTERVFKFE